NNPDRSVERRRRHGRRSGPRRARRASEHDGDSAELWASLSRERRSGDEIDSQEVAGRSGRGRPRPAVVIVSMALGGPALACEVAWQGARHCPRASAFYVELARKALLVDWLGRSVAAPQSRRYLTSVGAV